MLFRSDDMGRFIRSFKGHPATGWHVHPSLQCRDNAPRNFLEEIEIKWKLKSLICHLDNKRMAEYGECTNIKKFHIESNIIPGMFRFVCKQIKQHI